MPLPNDDRVVALANDLLAQFHKIFGPHPGFRPAHAKGIMLSGTFKSAAAAKSLTKAPHIQRESTLVTARFSNSTGLPEIPDSSPDANPRGLAIRFNLADHMHTDIVSHSTDGFPTRDGYEFLEFLRAAAGSGPEVPSPKPIEKFLGEHPSASDEHGTKLAQHRVRDRSARRDLRPNVPVDPFGAVVCVEKGQVPCLREQHGRLVGRASGPLAHETIGGGFLTGGGEPGSRVTPRDRVDRLAILLRCLQAVSRGAFVFSALCENQ